MSKLNKDEIEFVTQYLKQGKPLPDSYIFNFSCVTLKDYVIG